MSTVQNSTFPGGTAMGWTCQNCGAFVPNGVTHTCTWRLGGTPTRQVPNTDEKLDRIISLLEHISRDLESIRLQKR